ncbi:hypothetical protein [Aquitalea pelogenes]|uniref:hypothetical protein n=1 Tax=Aquitalea pelogenes TaxID=1293573 RepID=UPI0035B2439A
MKIKIIVLALSTCFALTACNDDKKTEHNKNKYAVDFTKSEPAPSKPSVPASAPTPTPSAVPIAPTNQVQPATASSTPAQSTQKSRRDRSTTTASALAEFNSGNYFHALVMTSEGFVSHPYRDNMGWALAYGWNISLNGQGANRGYATKAGLDKSTVEKIASMGISKGGKPNLDATPQPGISINPQQGLVVVDEMKKPSETAAIAWLGASTWNKLKSNQQAVLVDHFYRLGAGGAKQYSTMQKAVRNYANNPTDENSQKVAQTFVYKYRIKIGDTWQVKQDKRATALLGSLWLNPEAFSSMLSNKPISASASQTLQKVASYGNMKIDTSKPISQQLDEQDELDKLIDEMEAQGKKVEYQPVVNDKPIIPTFEEQKQEEKPKAKAPANNGCVKVNAQVWKCPPGVIPPELQ